MNISGRERDQFLGTKEAKPPRKSNGRDVVLGSSSQVKREKGG